jgi:hypothetical protein
MEDIARAFDCPPDSPEYEMLADTAWMGGPLIGVRFYLGRLIDRNLFRESDDAVEKYLVEYFSTYTSPAGADLLRGVDGWPIAADILRHRFEQQVGKSTHLARKLTAKAILAVELYLKDPAIRMAQLAKEMKTTQKQLERNALLNRTRWLKARRERARVVSAK